jgi:tetratricopeptide (TPR) repeat protein
LANPNFGDKVGSVDAALAHARSLLGDQPDAALAQAREVLRVAPTHPDALFLSGAALRRIGDPEAGRRILLPLAVDHPDVWALQFEIGVAQAALGETRLAVTALTRAAALNPNSAPAWHALGDQLAIVGDLASAEAAHARPLAGSVHDPNLQKGVQALLDGRPDEAGALLGRLNLHPTDIVAARMIANAAARLDREPEIELLLADCVARAPRFAPARQHLSVLLHQQNRDAEALVHLDHLVRQDPAAAGFRGLRVVVLIQLGEFQRAIEDCDYLLQAEPQQPPLWLTYGHALKTVGRQADAIAAFRQSLALSPGFGEAYWSLANLKTLRFEPADRTAMQAQLARPDLAQEDRIHLHYALGKALEDAACYADSFQHYQAGAGLRRSSTPYDPDANTAFVRRTMETFTPALLTARAGQGCQSPDPIFVLGLPRSGSTLIEQILASHSQVEGTKELPDLVAMARRLATSGSAGAPSAYPALLAHLDAAALSRLGEEFLERARVHRHLGRPFFIDKFPNNFMHVGLICLILPQARIIDARRHPMATCFSAFKQHFAQGQTYSYDLTDLGRYYADYVDLMAHFDRVSPGRIHRVQYERLVENTEVVVRSLLDYCGLDFEPGCLRFHETARAVQTASSEQVRRPIYTEGLDQWRHYEPWLGPLKAALGSAL